MRRAIFLFLAMMCSGVALGQTPPNWLQSDERERNYPSAAFLTGFTPGNVRAGETKADAAVRLRKDAQAELTEKIRVQVSSEKQKRDTRTKTQATGKEESEQIQSVFESSVTTSASLELTGVKTDSYVDDSKELIYGFAYVNRYELTGYYNASLTMTMQQLESVLNTAKQLETNGEKPKARKQYEEAVQLLVKAEQAQDVLIALDRNANAASLQRDKTGVWRNDIIQALARLSQGVYIYVESSEKLHGQKVNIVTNKLKAELAKSGCSFTENAEKADFRLKIDVTTRETDTIEGIFFSFADAQVELYDVRKQKVVYSDEIAQKGGGVSQDKAGRKAMDDVVPKIFGKLKSWTGN